MISENLDELSPLLRTAFVPARSAWLFDRRSGQEAGSHGKYAEGAVVARAASAVPSGLGRRLAADEGRHDRSDGRSECQLLLRDEVRK